MTLPRKASLQDYAVRAFAAVEGVLGAVEDDQLQRRGRDLRYAGRVEREVSVGDSILVHVTHASRHLDTIEGLRGLLFERHGSTTF